MPGEFLTGQQEHETNPRLAKILQNDDALNNLVNSFQVGHNYMLPTEIQFTKFLKDKDPSSEAFKRRDENRQKSAQSGVDISRQMELFDLTVEEANTYSEIVTAAANSGEITNENLEIIDKTQGKMIEAYKGLKQLGYSDSDLGVTRTIE